MCICSIEKIAAALKSVRVGASPEEYDIHSLVKSALENADIPCEHEYKLGARARIDFMCGGVGIEIKKSKPDRRKLIKQLERYAASEEITGMIVVLPRDMDLPDIILGKRVARVSLNRLWGVALP